MHPQVTRREHGESIAVVPARYAASRFPGKPLADIDGVPMIIRVARRVAQAKRLSALYVATDDARIQRVVEAEGFRAVLTSPACASGGDRVAEAVRTLGLEHVALVLNVQGDEPLIDPADLDALVEATLAGGAPMGTLARPLADAARFHDRNVVKVVVGRDGRALYFSRAPIPYDGVSLALMHVGIYAYRPQVLFELAALPRTPLEVQESLEQLRALENGIPIQVARCVSPLPSVAVDAPEDVARVVSVLRSISVGAGSGGARGSTNYGG